MNYTKGEWKAKVDRIWCKVIDPTNHVIASISVQSTRPVAEKQANAHLIAAAPDMYEALKALVGGTKHANWIGNKDAITNGQIALAKAEGK